LSIDASAANQNRAPRSSSANLPVEQIDRRGSRALEPFDAGLRHERIGVVAFGKRDDADGRAGAKQLVAGTERRLESRAVAVVEEEHVLRVLANQRGLLLGERGAERRDDLDDSGDVQPNQVEVALATMSRSAFESTASPSSIRTKRAFRE
jgi:hypothetical protein